MNFIAIPLLIMLGAVVPSTLTVFSIPIFITILFVLAVNSVKKAKSGIKIIVILLTILASIGIFRSSTKGLSLGFQIPFNRTLWKYNIDSKIRFYMSDDLISKVSKAKSTKDEITKMLGKPYYEYENTFCYFLKADSLIGLAYSELDISFSENDEVEKITISHPN